jgi:hypothetical protein
MNASDHSVINTMGLAVFDAIPKSVLAVMVWYLADACSDRGVGNDGEFERMREELDALVGSGLIEKSHHKRAVAAIKRAEGSGS